MKSLGRITLLTILVVSFKCFAQEPDAPSTAQPPVKISIWQQFKDSFHTPYDRHQPMSSWSTPFKSPSFVISATALVGTGMADVFISQHDFKNGCVEGNGDAGRRPGMGEQMAEKLGTSAAVMTMSYFLKRKHIKVLPEVFMSIGTGKNVHGIVTGLQSPCY